LIARTVSRNISKDNPSRSAANAPTVLPLKETWRIQRGSPGNPVGLHDVHTTLLHLVGFDQKLTGVNESKILKDILS